MRLLFILILIFVPGKIFSQISGIVMDKSSGYPLQFATIRIENGNTVTTSDIEGKFSLRENVLDKILVISAIGFITERIVAGKEFLRIELKTKVYQMNEVFVTAERNRTGLVAGKYDKDSVTAWYCIRTSPWMVSRSQMNTLRPRP
jgi:hypothetical protein